MILLSYDLTNQFASEYLFRINSEGGYPWFTFKDDEGRGDVYTWNEDPNLNSYWTYTPNEFNFNLHNDDLWADGKQVPYPNARLYSPYEVGDTVKLRLSKLSKEVYNFMNGLYAQQGSGGPFGIAPATVIGNVYNKKNSQERALGFFIVSDETYYEKIVSEEDVFTERTPELEEILNAVK